MAKLPYVEEEFFPLFGWMADRDSLVWKNQYGYSSQIDVRTTPEYIQLAKKPERSAANQWSWFSTWTNLMLCAVDTLMNVWTSWNNFYFWENGKIYSSVSPFDNVGTMTTSKSITNAVKFGNRYLWFYQSINNSPALIGQGKIGSITASTAPVNGVGAWNVAPWYNESFQTFSTQSAVAGFNSIDGMFPCYNDSDHFLYFAGGSTVYRLDENTLTLAVWFDFEQQVTGIQKEWGLLRIYTQAGRIYYRDGFSHQYDYFIETHKNIFYVWNKAGVDHMITASVSQYSSMYLNQGWAIQLYKSSLEDNGIGKYMYTIANRWSNYTMAMHNNILYFTGEDWAKKTIESYGNVYVWYPNSYEVETKINALWNQIDAIWMLHAPLNVQELLFFSQREATTGNCSMDYIFVWQQPQAQPLNIFYHPSGELYTKRFSGSWASTMDEAIELVFRLSWTLNAVKTITVQAAVDWSQTYNTIVAIWTLDPVFDNGRYRVVGSPISLNFHEIQFKIILTTTDEHSTPRLYWMKLRYKPNIDW